MNFGSDAHQGDRTGDHHVGKEMLALISLKNFDRSGHIGSFRSIVGEAEGIVRPLAGVPSVETPSALPEVAPASDDTRLSFANSAKYQ